MTAMNDFEHESLTDLVRAARQLVDNERRLAGAQLPADVNPLPAGAAAVENGVVDMGRTGKAARSDDTNEWPDVPAEDKAAALATIDGDEVRKCMGCVLCKTRTQTVFGDGNAKAELVFVGEGPGADEDEQGLPFVGRAGQKLNEMIAAMGLRREDVYICNVVKCRPPGNRSPEPAEMQACWGYLERQIRIIRPRVIVVLGNAAAKALLKSEIGITKLRGQWQELWGIPVMPTFHPAYLLRQYTPDNRRRVWSDLQAVMEKLGLKQ